MVDALPRAKKAEYCYQRLDGPTTCSEGTRAGILGDIQTWIDDVAADSPHLFWLSDTAGVGRSTISKLVAQRADDEGYLGASFFFSRDDESLRDPALVFPTIAYQLAQFSKELRSHLGEALENSSDAAYESRSGQLQKLIVHPLSQRPSYHRPILVVLDAFDRCDQPGAREILEVLLAASTRASFRLKVLITGRPEPHIRSVFNQESQVCKGVLRDDFEMSEACQDVETNPGLI